MNILGGEKQGPNFEISAGEVKEGEDDMTFYSNLLEGEILEEIMDYHALYLKCDALLLADVFEKIRNNNLKNHGLCPDHYLSAPALSWDAMLNMTKMELELITDPDMYIFFENGTRGGISNISNTYSKMQCLI